MRYTVEISCDDFRAAMQYSFLKAQLLGTRLWAKILMWPMLVFCVAGLALILYGFLQGTVHPLHWFLLLSVIVAGVSFLIPFPRMWERIYQQHEIPNKHYEIEFQTCL